MKKGFVLLVVLTFGFTLTGCRTSLKDYKETNELENTREEVLEIYEIIVDKIENHPDYPGTYTYDLMSDFTAYSSDEGVSKNDLIQTNHQAYYESNATTIVLGAIRSVHNDFLTDLDFEEGVEFTNAFGTITLFVNKGYLEFHLLRSDIESWLYVKIDDDNIIYEYKQVRGYTTQFYSNDFNDCFKDIYMYENDDKLSYSYTTYDYKDKTYEYTYINPGTSIWYRLIDLDKRYGYLFRVEDELQRFDIHLFENNFIDIKYSESDSPSYSVYYNLENVSNWDSIVERKVYSSNTEMFSDYTLYTYAGAIGPAIEVDYDSFNSSVFGQIDGAEYTGNYSYDDILDIKETLTKKATRYSVDFENNTYTVNDKEYSLEELQEYVRNMVPTF